MQKQIKARSVCSRIGLALFAMMAIIQLGVLGIMLLCNLFFPALLDSEAGLWLINDLGIYALGMPVFLLILHFIPDGPAEEDNPRFRMNFGRFLLILLVCFGLAYISSFITQLLAGFDLDEGNAIANLAEASLLVRVFFGALVPAFGEEFLFRYMLRRKLRGAGDKIYILFSALLFGLFHGTFSQLLFAFAVGIIFAWVYSQTGVIWYSVAMHFLFNCMSLVVLQFALDYIGLILLFGLFMLAAVIVGIVIVAVYGRHAWRSLRPPTQPGWPYNMPKTPPHGNRQYAYPAAYAGNGWYTNGNYNTGVYPSQYSGTPQYTGQPPYSGLPYVQPGYSQPAYTQPGYPYAQPGPLQPQYGGPQQPYAVQQQVQPAVKPYKYAYSNDFRTMAYTDPEGQKAGAAPVAPQHSAPGGYYQPSPYAAPQAAGPVPQKKQLFPPAPLPQFPYSGPGALSICLLNVGFILFTLLSVGIILMGILL